MYSYVERSKIDPARKICMDFLRKAKKRLEDEYDIMARIYPMGSAAVNLVTQNGDGPFDLDYDLAVKRSGIDCRELKQKFLSALDKEAACFGFSRGKDSTSVITYIHRSKDGIDFSLDIGIVVMEKGSAGSRLIHHKDLDSYVLEKSMDFQQVTYRYSQIKKYNMIPELRKIYLKKKNHYLIKGDKTRHSYSIYAEAVNETFQKIK